MCTGEAFFRRTHFCDFERCIVFNTMESGRKEIKELPTKYSEKKSFEQLLEEEEEESCRFTSLTVLRRTIAL